MPPRRIVTLVPGHFHAALIQKEMLAGIDPHVDVYGPLDSDLIAHLQRIAAFNGRSAKPTAWTLDVHAGDDWQERFLRDTPGDIVVVSGRNRRKIDLMEMAVAAGKHVLADKPWIIEAADFPRVPALLQKAHDTGLLVYDIMTERYEITSRLQRDLVNDCELFGAIDPGEAERPGVVMESVHYLKKQVSGVPLRRPGWFFDINEEGEALADVGTHLVDQVTWVLFCAAPLDPPRDIQFLSARRWPTVLSREQFQAITGLDDFPPQVHAHVKDGRLHYFCNNRVTFKLRDVNVRLDVVWDDETPPGGGDTHNAAFHGTKASVSIRQAGGALPELFVTPHEPTRAGIRTCLERRVAAWQAQYPGVHVVAAVDEYRIVIPDQYRTGHETHFAEVAAQFLRYLDAPQTMPPWETPHTLAKYFVTTHGVLRSRQAAASS